MEWLEVTKQVLFIITAIVAIYGIDSWRREHKGKRQIELAEETLALFYEAADAIKDIRHPAVFSHEYEDLERLPGESEEAFRARKSASIVFVRYNRHQELFNKIHATRYRFMAQIGKSEADPFDDLRKAVVEITGAARALARLWPHNHFRTEKQEEEHRTRVQKFEAIFWDGLMQPDPINEKVNKLLSDMETTCHDVISGKGTLHGFLNRKVGALSGR